MEVISLENVEKKQKYTALFYCAPGVGKTTAIGLIAEKSEGKTLILDVDRTILTSLSKKEVVKDVSKIDVMQIDTIETWQSWSDTLQKLGELKKDGKLIYDTIAVDNISELERCILSDLGSKGKNKGVPAQADYQYMQFKLVNSLRYLKSLGVNVILTAWETTEQFVQPDGTSYSRLYPKISAKIVDNICGLCDVVGKILTKSDNSRVIVLEAMQNVYAKNQLDDRKGCKVEEFIVKKENK